MTTPRSTQIDLTATAFYHCITRCVRRAYLNGFDQQTGKDYSHRKQWLVSRIKHLASIFAIDICAFAIMSNHYHLVLHANTKNAKEWTQDEIIQRWSHLFPRDAAKIESRLISKEQVERKTSLWLERLQSISWFMRCLNENIARRSNREDDCNGRFWEGRFKSQALLDEGGLLSAMVYVDLNPIRAKQATTPEESEFTSIYERINTLKMSKLEKRNLSQPKDLMPFQQRGDHNDNDATINFNLLDYIQLVDTTGRIIREDKKGSIPSQLLPILSRLSISSAGWLEMVNQLENVFSYAVGKPLLLSQFCQSQGRRNSKGFRAAKSLYTQSVQIN